METFTVKMEVGSLSGGEFVAVNALVNTGSSLAALPASLLHRLGVIEERRRRFELANGDVVEYPVGPARVRLAGQDGIIQVVFAPEDFAPRVGAVTLSSLCLQPDPVEQKLIPFLPRVCNHPQHIPTP